MNLCVSGVDCQPQEVAAVIAAIVTFLSVMATTVLAVLNFRTARALAREAHERASDLEDKRHKNEIKIARAEKLIESQARLMHAKREAQLQRLLRTRRASLNSLKKAKELVLATSARMHQQTEESEFLGKTLDFLTASALVFAPPNDQAPDLPVACDQPLRAMRAAAAKMTLFFEPGPSERPTSPADQRRLTAALKEFEDTVRDFVRVTQTEESRLLGDSVGQPAGG